MNLSDPQRRTKLKDYANGQRMVTGDLENYVNEKTYTRSTRIWRV